MCVHQLQQDDVGYGFVLTGMMRRWVGRWGREGGRRGEATVQSTDCNAGLSVCVCVHQLQQDDVGYGFVLRGTSPCYVHTIDPLGPAAAAGLKVSLCLC